MIEFPSTTVVNRILPKDKFLEHLDLTPNLKKKLISDIVHIKILNKFSKSLLNFREEVDEVECSKSLYLRGGVRRMSDGGVTEFVVNHNSLEQTQSRADSKNAPLCKGKCHAVTERFSNNQEKIILNTLDCHANACNDSNNCCSNTLSLNLDNSSSVTLSTCKQVTSPQGEALGNTYHSSTTNHAEALGSAIEKPIKEVLLLQIELKKHDFDSKLIETIAKQNSHKLVFLLRFDKYSKLAVYYKQLYIGKWKPFEEVSLTLNGNNMNEVWISFVEQIALEESGVVGLGCDEDDCSNTTGEVVLKPLLEEGNKRGGDRIRSLLSSVEQPSSQTENEFINTLTLNKVSSGSVTLQSAKADSSPQVEPLGHHEAALSQYSKVISKSDLDHKLDLQNKAKALQKEIAKLDTAIRREKQPNRKFELHKKLMELEESLRALRLV